jgi:membrane-bound lytic murein transglycosylase F
MHNRFLTRINTAILFLFIIFVPGSFTLPQPNNFLGHDDKGGLLADIQRRGKLVAITDDNPFNYFTYKGEPKGYQYDMLESFAGFLGVELELIVEPDPHRALLYLRQRQVDVVAMELPASAELRKGILFTEPLFNSKQVLVQRKPDKWRRMRDMTTVENMLVRNLDDLSNKKIALPSHKQKQFYLSDIQHETSNSVDIIAFNDVNVVDLIEAVASKEVDYTIAYEHTALAMARLYPDLDVNTTVSPEMGVTWAVQLGSVNLAREINNWIEERRDGREFVAAYSQYYKNSRWARLALGQKLQYQGISDYDEHIKHSGKMINWDWRLIAALIYKESRFHPDVVSHRGAFGLMQLMPHTAKRFGADINSTPAEQITAGAKLIQYLDKSFINTVPDPEERIKFVLASYNIGQAHIIDAQNLALKHGKNPNIWYDNVEYFLLAKSQPEFYNDPVVKYGKVKGIETQNFVTAVLEKYDQYKILAAR